MCHTPNDRETPRLGGPPSFLPLIGPTSPPPPLVRHASSSGPCQHHQAGLRWLPGLDLTCVSLASALWYLLPQVGPWPLFLALLPWILRLAWTGRLTSRTPLDLPLGLFVVSAGLGVWAAYDRPVAWHKFWLIVAAVLIYYAFANAQPLGQARSWLLAAFGAGVALYFLASHDGQAYPAKIPALARLGWALQAPLPDWPGHRMNPNVAAGVLAMMLPFAGLVTLHAWQQVRQAGVPRRRTRWLRLVGALGLLSLTLFGLVLTVSRGAWLAVASALLMVALWAVAGRLAGATRISRAAAFAALLGLILLVTLGLLWPHTIAAAWTALPGDNAASGRLELLQRTATLLADYPLLGAGLGGFQMLYSTYALLIHVGYAPHSHNLFFDVALEQGLPGLLALAAMCLLFARTLWQAHSRQADHRPPLAATAGAVSLLILLLHGLADDPLYSGRGVLLLFIPFAFGAPLPGEPPARRWVTVLPTVLLVLLGFALLWRDPLLSLTFSNLGAIQQSQAELSLYRWPEWPLQDEVRRLANLERPLLAFERALALNPRNGTAHRRLGMIDLARGHYPEALNHLQVAGRAEPRSPATQQLLGEAYLANGHLEEGRTLWSGASNNLRQLDLRVAWYRHIGDGQRATWLQQAIPGQP